MIKSTHQELLRGIVEELINISDGRENAKLFIAICGEDSSILKTILKGDVSFLENVISLIFNAISTAKEFNDRDRRTLINFILFKLFELSPEFFKAAVSDLIQKISDNNAMDIIKSGVVTDAIH